MNSNSRKKEPNHMTHHNVTTYWYEQLGLAADTLGVDRIIAMRIYRGDCPPMPDRQCRQLKIRLQNEMLRQQHMDAWILDDEERRQMDAPGRTALWTGIVAVVVCVVVAVYIIGRG